MRKELSGKPRLQQPSASSSKDEQRSEDRPIASSRLQGRAEQRSATQRGGGGMVAGECSVARVPQTRAPMRAHTRDDGRSIPGIFRRWTNAEQMNYRWRGAICF